MEVLFVKPRDFRISVIEINVEEIRKKLQKTENARPSIRRAQENEAPKLHTVLLKVKIQKELKKS